MVNAAALDTASRLHIGCGEMPDPGFVRLKDCPPPWPLPAQTVSEILCVDHVHRLTPVGGAKDGLVRFMNELYRVLVPGGTARIVHPHGRTDRALADPTAARVITDQTWWFFDRQWREDEHCRRPSITADFEIVSIEAPLRAEWSHRAPAAQAFALEHYWNIVGDVTVVLRARESPSDATVAQLS